MNRIHHAAPLAVVALAGCLTNPVEECTTSAECSDAFGFGSVCGDEGYCEAATFPERCLSSYPEDVLTDPSAYTDSIVMVSLYDAVYDNAERQSARLAIEQADDGIDGKSFAVIECSYQEEEWEQDDLDYPGAVTMLAEFFTGELGIQAYVGPYTSGTTLAWHDAVKGYETVPFIISGAATSPAITYADGIEHTDADPGVIWRTIPPDSLQGKVAAQDMWDRGRRHVAVVYQEGAYGEGLAQIFTEEFTAAGGEVESFQFADVGTMAAHAATIDAEPAIEEVFVISGESSDIAAFLNSAASTENFVSNPADPYPNSGKGILLPDAAADIDLFRDAETAGEIIDCRPGTASGCTSAQIRGTRPAIPANTRYTAFKTAYAARYGEDPEATVYMPFAYDAAWLAMTSAAWSYFQVGEITGKGMGAGMRRVSSGDCPDGAKCIELLPTGWPTALASFEAGQSIDVEGASGPLDFDPDSEETATAIEVWVINATVDGFDVVDTVEP